VLTVPDRGEFFLRDTGGSGPAVLLVHGWMFPSDLNWLRVYGPLEQAGYRVLAMDLRGHGRGLRSTARFRLEDCADDAAAVLAAVGVDSALVIGYSMGGPVTQLMARRHPELVDGFVLCATALDWQDPRQKVFWHAMAGLRLVLGLFPLGSWRAMVRVSGGTPQQSSWVAAELSRGSARDLAEAGRELSRWDSNDWVSGLPQPAAVVVTTRDRLVPPAKQEALAAALGVHPQRVEADHDACATAPRELVRALLEALSQIRGVAAAPSAPETRTPPGLTSRRTART